MTDRELLERAAKAAGYATMECSCKKELRADSSPRGYRHWNPLTDDGDALRLAVKLRLMVHISGVIVDGVHVQSDHAITMELYGDDPAAATRRAIVRAAAALAQPTA